MSNKTRRVHLETCPAKKFIENIFLKNQFYWCFGSEEEATVVIVVIVVVVIGVVIVVMRVARDTR